VAVVNRSTRADEEALSRKEKGNRGRRSSNLPAGLEVGLRKKGREKTSRRANYRQDSGVALPREESM